MILDSLLAGVMLFSSFALRTPNVQPNPDDYEISIGDTLNLIKDIMKSDVEFIVDESPERAGRFIAGTHVPIVDKNHLDGDEEKPTYIIIFAWNFSSSIISRTAKAATQDTGFPL